MGINEKLMRIQTHIKAPKNLYNKFGEYYYRNAESICEAVKPFLEQEKCTLQLGDEICLIGDRFYVKATAVLQDCESDECVVVSAYAREAESKPKMDNSQVTGSCSSYARKYALNGMFLLDDTKDADTDEYQKEMDNRNNAGKAADKGKKTTAKATTANNSAKVSKETPEEAKKNEEMRESVDPVYVPTADGKISDAQWKKYKEELARTGLAEAIILSAVSVEKHADLTEPKMLTILKKFKNTPSKA
jgi:hypothetical protein